MKTFMSAALLAAAVGCAEEPKEATAIAVEITTDIVDGQLAQIWFGVFPADADPKLVAPTSELTMPLSDHGRPFVVEKGNADDFLLVVRGLRPNTGPDTAMIEYRVRAHFQVGETLYLPVPLMHSCVDVPCAGAFETCVEMLTPEAEASWTGTCVPTPGPRTLSVLRDPTQWPPGPEAGGICGDDVTGSDDETPLLLTLTPRSGTCPDARVIEVLVPGPSFEAECQLRVVSESADYCSYSFEEVCTTRDAAGAEIGRTNLLMAITEVSATRAVGKAQLVKTWVTGTRCTTMFDVVGELVSSAMRVE